MVSSSNRSSTTTHELIDLNSEYLYRQLPVINRADVGFGLGGALLFLLYKYRLRQAPADLARCQTYFRRLIEILNTGENRDSLFIEWTEVAFFIRKYGAYFEADYDLEDMLSQLDPQLSGYAQALLKNNCIDPYVGAFHQAFYFLHYPAIFYKEIETFIDYIKTAINEPQKGHYYLNNKQMPGIQLGITHGQSFFLVFLAKAYEAGIRKQDCIRLIAGISRFVHYQKLEEGSGAHLFPNIVGSSDFTRLGLAYGDLGTLYGLLRAAEALGDQAMYEQIIQWLKQCSQRKSETATGICHHNLLYGKAGPAVYFRWLAQHTADEDFLQTSNYWYAELEKELHNLTSDDLKPFDTFNYAAMQQVSLLEGLSGSLIAAMGVQTNRLDFNHLFYIS